MKRPARVPIAAGALLILAAACQPGGNPPITSAPGSRVTASSPVVPLRPSAPPAVAAVPTQPAPVPATPGPYLEILKLKQAGASDEDLLTRVRAANLRYALTTAEILELREAGVSEAVVEAMLRSGG